MAEKTDRIQKMNPTETNFGGKNFKEPDDFEREFRPTKWSIRKYVRFVDTLDRIERDKFVKYSVLFLSTSYYDKDTFNFLQQIHIKRKDDFGHDPYADFFTVEQVTIKKRSVNAFVSVMADMHNQGIIQCSVVKLAEILQNTFNVKYSLTTIKDKIYKYQRENNKFE